MENRTKSNKHCKHHNQKVVNVFQNKCSDCGVIIGVMPKKKDMERELVKEVWNGDID